LQDTQDGRVIQRAGLGEIDPIGSKYASIIEKDKKEEIHLAWRILILHLCIYFLDYLTLFSLSLFGYADVLPASFSE